MTANEGKQLMRRSTFRISLGLHRDPETKNQLAYFGTGFFVTREGLALTAYHNFKGCKRRVFEATYGGKTITLKWLKEKSSKKRDIAVMELRDNPGGVKIIPMKAAYLDLSYEEAARLQYFGGRKVLVFGFPQRGHRADEWLIEGQVDAGLPIIRSEEGRNVWVERLHIIGGTRVWHLGGMSGAGILDLSLGRVLGVEGACLQGPSVNERDVRGTEIAQLLEEHPDLAVHFDRIEPVDGPRADPEAYLRFLVDSYRYLDIRGMGISDKVALQMELADLYVPLRARRELPAHDKWGPSRVAGRPVPLEHESEPVQLDKLIQDNSGLIILGDPGSGKTTFLKHLTLQLAKAREDSSLPVLVPLSEYANTLASDEVPLVGFIDEYFEKKRGMRFAVSRILEPALKRGKAWILLDGLDEVKDVRDRNIVVQRVLDFYNQHRRAGNKFVMTSRIVGYRDVRRAAEGLAECTLVDFDDVEVEAFAEKWTLALESAVRGMGPAAIREAEREKQELLNEIRRNPGVRDLAANPLLLTILALMKRQGVTLPERRVELYHKCVEALLSTWNRARGLGRPPTRDLDVFETIKILGPLARWMHETSPGVGLVKQEEMVRKLEELYGGRGIRDPEQVARRLIEDVREHACILLERGPREFGFIHLTFEEYLAAVGVAMLGQCGVDPIVREVLAHLSEPAWREVALLTVSYLGIVHQREEAADAVVEALLSDARTTPGAAVVLAGEAVVDAWPGGVTASCRDRTITRLLETMQDDAKVEPVLRARAGNILAELGDPRPEVVPQKLEDLAAMEFCYIPPGPFNMGRGTERHVNSSLRRGCWIGRFPVTMAQFSLFVKAGGYQEETWWTQARAAGFWKGGKFRGPYEQESRAGLADFGYLFSLPNHPVVGVSWYEAHAYCLWLTEKWRDSLPTGWVIRMPSETEWEKAARGGLRVMGRPLVASLIKGLRLGTERLRLVLNPAPDREFPWLGGFDTKKANVGETSVGATSAVGCFPGGASPYGVMELSGNVMEWTRSHYRRYPYDAADGREVQDAPVSVRRAVRGGAFYLNADHARCSHRFVYDPLHRYDDLGFRVAASPSSGL